MPRKNNNARVPSRSRKSSTAAPTPTTTTRTIAEDKLWGALRANPGATTAELSISAGIGKSTAGKLLAAWAADGSVARTSGTHAGRRTADRWTIPATDAPAGEDDDPTGGGSGPSDTAPASLAPQPTATPATGTSTDEAPNVADSAATTKAPRLGKGALRGMVEDHLRTHAGEEFSPNAIGKALDRSSGAVNNALEKLVTDGYAVRTQDKPKRFAIKPEN